MPGTWKNRILDYQDTPPPEAWTTIASQLDAEVSPADLQLAARISTTTITPPPDLFDGIIAALENSDTLASPTKVRSMPFRRLAVAVSLGIIATIAAIYFLSGKQVPENRPLASVLRKTAAPKSPAVASLPVLSPAEAIAVGPGNSLRLAASPRSPRAFTSTIDDIQPAEDNEPDLDNIPVSDLQPVQAQEQVSVPSTPLRDAQGNIIMDMNLITHPGDPYITVTGPNGIQTKISNKFLSCLSYLNDDQPQSPSDNAQANECIDRFKAWRDKLLSGDSFIPSAGNFFDIFEMKDLIQE